MVAASKVEYFVPDVGVRSAKLRTPTSKDESLSRYEEALLGRELLEKAGMRERHEPPANLFGQDIISKMTPQKGRYDPRRVAALAQPGCRGGAASSWRAVAGDLSGQISRSTCLRTTEGSFPIRRPIQRKLRVSEAGALLDRLAKPKEDFRRRADDVGLSGLTPRYGQAKPLLPTSGELEVLLSQRAARAKTEGVDVREVLERLSAPKVSRPHEPLFQVSSRKVPTQCAQKELPTPSRRKSMLSKQWLGLCELQELSQSVLGRPLSPESGSNAADLEG